MYLLNKLFAESIITKEWILKNIQTSREKDFTNDFRKMVYENETEMINVLGDIKNNTFINQQKIETKKYIKKVREIIKMVND